MKGSISINTQILQQFFEKASSAFVICDASLHIMYFNQAACDLLRLDQARHVGSELTTVLPDLARYKQDVTTLASDEATFEADDIATASDKVRLQVKAFKAEGFVFVQCSARSATEHKWMEIGQVHQHALRTLRENLTALLGWNNMAQRDVDSEMVLHYLKQIDGEALQASQLIGDLLDLDYVRKTSRQYSLISFERLIDQVIEKLKRKASFNQVFFTKDILYNQKFYSDKALLSMMFSQLYDNALSYRRADVQTVIQTTIIDDRDGIQIMIEDNGKGLSRTLQNDIVKLFYHTSAIPDSLGVGLYTVKNCLEQLNGKILVESTPGHGATFILNIPNAFKEPKL